MQTCKGPGKKKGKQQKTNSKCVRRDAKWAQKGTWKGKGEGNGKKKGQGKGKERENGKGIAKGKGTWNGRTGEREREEELYIYIYRDFTLFVSIYFHVCAFVLLK